MSIHGKCAICGGETTDYSCPSCLHNEIKELLAYIYDRADAFVAVVRQRDRAEKELAEVLATLARERAIDQPEDRLWRAKDRTWWRRNEKGDLVRADPPA